MPVVVLVNARTAYSIRITSDMEHVACHGLQVCYRPSASGGLAPDRWRGTGIIVSFQVLYKSLGQQILNISEKTILDFYQATWFRSSNLSCWTFAVQRAVRALSINGIGGGKNDQGFGQRVVLPRANGNLVCTPPLVPKDSFSFSTSTFLIVLHRCLRAYVAWFDPCASRCFTPVQRDLCSSLHLQIRAWIIRLLGYLEDRSWQRATPGCWNRPRFILRPNCCVFCICHDWITALLFPCYFLIVGPFVMDGYLRSSDSFPCNLQRRSTCWHCFT